MIDPNEFLPKGRSIRSAESKILKEHRKHQGVSELDAKHQYTKTARALPTYGVTFFLVKEKQKGKKKLVPRLLGINAEAILRLSEETKEVLQVWPLTQVKTYHAGKSETFTLNFGDYSDKEYSVKTNDAARIRDILQGYIDIIKRRMDARHRAFNTEHYAVMEDHVEASRGLTMEHVSHNSSKIVQETFVGPSKIVSYEPGQQVTQGTQIVTVQQIVVTGKGSNHQNVVRSEVPMRKDMSMDFVRKLNRLNSNSVKVVSHLAEPTDAGVVDARLLVESMRADMPSIEEGVNAAAQQQGSEEARSRLLEQLAELRDCMKALADATDTTLDPEEAEEAAKGIADLSTQMYFSLDPRTIKRGEFCRRSRKSFIQDEKMDATLRRASFIAASQTACGVIDDAKSALDKNYQGSDLDASEVEELEKAAEDKIGKLNAAIALYLTAYSDPQNIDYSAAVTSMNTINELIPELTKDAQRLSAVNDGKSREELLEQMRGLCDAAKMICLLNKPEDHDKIQEAVKDYGRASEKLLFTFKRMKKGGDDNNLQNEILDLARDVGDKTSLLLVKANELTSLAPEDPRSAELDHAGVRCADATKDLLTCASLTAPSIAEPHCRSALSAAAEALGARAQALAPRWKPLVEPPARRALADGLRDGALDLAKALDRLKAAFAGLNGMPDDDDSEKAKEIRRLKFITTVGGARKKLDDAQDDLNKPFTGTPVQGAAAEELKRRMAEKIAQLNAALAALVGATADRNKPDYATADLAVATITELMPEIVKDGKALSADQDEKARADMLADLKALCDATNDVCQSSENNSPEDLNNSAAKLAKTSGKLFYVFNPRANKDKENEILDVSSSACVKAGQMLTRVQQLAREAGGEASGELDAAGSRVADAANALLTAAQLTAPCMQDPRCQSTLMSAASALEHASQGLAAVYAPLVRDPRFQAAGNTIEGDRRDLQQELDRLKKACQLAENNGAAGAASAGQEGRRLKFVTTVGNAKKRLDEAEDELKKPLVGTAVTPVSEQAMADKLARLNAALAALVAASADRDKPDYATADQAVATVATLMPQIVEDGKALSANKDEKARAEMLADLKALCDAARDLCASSERGSIEDLNKSAVKFGNTSGKLVYVFNPRADQEKEHEIIDLSSSACKKASEMLAEVNQLAASVGGDSGDKLDAAGSKVADAANALLVSAQLTSPCIQDPRCQSSLVSTAAALDHASQQLASLWAPLVRDPRLQAAGRKLEADRLDLQKELDRLKKACQVAPSGVEVKHMDPVQERQRVQFVNTAVTAEANLQKAQKELNKPLVPSRPDQKPASMQSKLAQSLNQLNAAIATLLAATADRDDPNYDEAEQALHDINHLMPQVIKETKALSATKEGAERQALLDGLRATCDATRGICVSLREGKTQDAAKLAATAAKLTYVVSPQSREQIKVVELSASACQAASRVASDAHRLAAERPAARAWLGERGARAADAAAALMATTQLVGPCLHEPASQAAVLSAAEALQAAGEQLAAPPAAAAPADAQLNQHCEELAQALDALKAAVREEGGAAKTPSRRTAPPPPARSVSSETAERLPAAAGLRGTRDFNKEFLDRMRCEESHNAELASESQRKAEEEKAQKQQFTKAVDEASLKIQKAEEDVHKLFSTKDEVIPALSVDQTLVVQKQMEQKLALAGVAVADLVACNHADAMDLPTASKSTITLADVVPHIVNDAKLLRGSMDENEKKSFLADVTGLFAATKNLLDTAKNDRKTLDKSAVEFGNRSAKLLYVVSTDVDPSQEKEVLEVVRDINESAGRAAVLGAAAAGALPAAGAERLCRAGGRCAEAASVLAYTAKLVAPSIQNANSHEALAQASTRLSDNLQAYAATWKPLEAAESGTVQQLRAEAASLESLLEGLRKDLGSGNLIKRRAVERVVVEDTPLRQLALIVLEGAKRKAESTSTSPELRVKYAKYANELSQAIKELDLANYRCRQASHDTEKRQNLEYAVQNLQVTLLQSRPTLDDRPQNNIVDLTDYVKDIASDADKLNKVCKDDLPELQTIRGHCEKISAKAAQVMSPSEQQALDGAFDDIQEVEQFAEECYKRVNAVNSVVEPLKDGKLKIDLQEAAIRLSEDCNMLRFATKSALATSQSVSLDATLEDLTDLEQRIDEMLVPGDGSSVPKKLSALGSGPSRLVAASSRACAGVAADLPPAFTAYMNDVRVCTDLNNPGDRQRSKAHLVKILHLLRALTMTTSRHVATWQKLGHPDTAEITGQIIEELESHKSHLDAASGKPQRSALSEVDMNKLLFPAVAPVQVDQKQVPAQALQAAAAKLSLCAGAVLQGAHAGALPRSAHAAARAAADLAGVACSLRTTDLAHNQKIDEATKEVSLQTYNVLRTADVFNQDPKNYAARRRLLDACRLLNDAINNLVRHTSDGGRLRRECGELTRALQLQQALAAALPASAMPYADCLDALHGQSEVLQKLNSDEPMSREEFSRTLGYASAAVCHSSEYAAQCAYLLQVAEENKDLALEGFMDSSRIMNLSEAVQDTCHRIIRTDVEQAKEEAVILDKQVQDLQQAVTEARDKTKDASVKEQLTTASAQVGDSAKVLHAVVHETCPNRAKITSWTIKLVDAVKSVDNIVESASLAPELKNVSTETMAKRDEILNHSRSLSSGMVSLLREVKAADDMDPMTWVTFGTSRKAILDAIDALVKSVKENGKRAGVLQKTESDLEEDDAPKKSYVQIQLDLANKWLRKPISKADVKNAGDDAAKNIIKLGEKMAEDLKDNEQEEVLQLVAECKALLADCYKKHDQEKAIALMERLKELRKTIERGVVTRVVEDFLEGEEPLADLDILADAEKDESKRKFLLERKLAELLAHLARVARTARLAAGAGSGGPQLAADLGRCSDQTELLAPMLVKAAQQRVASPDDQAAIEHYQKLLAQYAESLANVRSLCDQAVDPMEFVQTAGETMQRMREESNHQNDPQKCAYASMAITKLANRVINVSLSSTDVRRDPELQKALKEAKQRLKAAVPPPNARASKIPDWKDTTAEILRTTGEVESVLGGEIIFKKQQGADQPIFAAAFDLHTAVREWSARDNEIVAVAKRMAVLMAKLSDYMNTDRKRELLATTKSIVAESHEVASLATKLAHECTDVRIKTNLLQVCERIPTISGQLKMLATVKGSTLGNQGLKEDQEAMIMLVGNAQNLMLSVQEVVKAAASATVKIASQRGGARMRWVRRNYY